MIRLTLILAIVIVLAMIVLPSDDPGSGGGGPEGGADIAASEDGRPARTDLSGSALMEDEDGRLVLRTREGEDLTIDMVIEPSALTAEDAQVNLPPAETSGGVRPVPDTAVPDTAVPDTAVPETAADSPEAGAETPDAPSADRTVTRLRVTGDRVNFRAGPSTGDAILAALTQGTVVELIERVDDGWAHLRVPETGLSGYMSEDFLEPAN